MKKHYTPHIVYAHWGNDYENKGEALWYAHSIENAIEQHNLNFPNETVYEVKKCDEDHMKTGFDLLG